MIEPKLAPDRDAALFIEGAERIEVDACHFRRVDGNALFLSRYTRNVTISRSDFEWIGDGAMATWGETDRFDATGGEQPRFTTVRANFVRELGLYEKQSSAWGQAKACLSTLEDNVFFNMPRAPQPVPPRGITADAAPPEQRRSRASMSAPHHARRRCDQF